MSKEWWEKTPTELAKEANEELLKNQGGIMTEQEEIEADAQAGYKPEDDG